MLSLKEEEVFCSLFRQGTFAGPSVSSWLRVDRATHASFYLQLLEELLFSLLYSTLSPAPSYTSPFAPSTSGSKMKFLSAPLVALATSTSVTFASPILAAHDSLVARNNDGKGEPLQKILSGYI